MTLICVGLSTSSGALKGAVAVGQGDKILAACALAGSAYGALCDAGFDQVDFCDLDAEETDNAATGELFLSAEAFVAGMGYFAGASRLSQAGGPHPDLILDLGDQVALASLTTDPVDLVAYQAYEVIADIRCAPPGTIVGLAMLGSDGWEQATSCVVTGNDTCTMEVDGAKPGVVDEITVTINDPTSPTGVLWKKIARTFD